MSKLRKKNENNKVVRNTNSLAVIPQEKLLKINRWVFATITGLMATVVVMGIFLIPDNQAVFEQAQEQKNIALYERQMNPVLSAEVDALKSQLVGVVSGSIETKLKNLEESLRVGSIGLTGMETIHSLQNDLQVLKTYSETGAGRLIATQYRTPDTAVSDVQSVALVHEINQLKGLVSLLLGSCALMFAAVAGIWVRKRYALSYDSPEQRKIL